MEKEDASDCSGGDFLTKYDIKSCPNQQFWSSENLNSDFNLEVMKNAEVKEALQLLSTTIGR